MGIFAQHAPTYAAAGLATFPVDPRAKRPTVSNWQRSGLRATCAWLDKFGDADGLGLCMGERTRIVEVDVDIVGDAALAAAMERFGETPITIRTPSGKSKAWFRYSGEGRRIRPIPGLPVDVLGAGFTIAPPSYRADLGRSYEFLTGSLADLERLPYIRADAVETIRSRAAEAVREGERGNTLFLWCMLEARHCDNVDALIDAAQTWAAAMPVPLETNEVARTARSAWGYETAGRNFVGLRRPQTNPSEKAMDDLIDKPDAFLLLQLLARYHSTKAEFRIAPTAMSKARIPPWDRSRIERARDVLTSRGYLEILSPPNARRRMAGRYRLATRDIRNNHYTSLPPSEEQAT